MYSFSFLGLRVRAFRLEESDLQEGFILESVGPLLVAQAISAAADGVTYNVRLENGVDQYYLLEVPPGITPIKLNPSEWNQPQYATGGLPMESLTAFAVLTTFPSSSRGVLST